MEGIESAEAFEMLCQEVISSAWYANEQMNAHGADWDWSERGCWEAQRTAGLAEHLQRRLVATVPGGRLDAEGMCHESLLDLSETLYADQLLTRQLRDGMVRHPRRISSTERREHQQMFMRILATRARLYHSLEVLRLLLFEYELDVRQRTDARSPGLSAVQAMLTGLGW